MNSEVWKDIKGYEGLYQVSNLGNVRSLNFNHIGEIRVLKPILNRYGYLFVNLCHEGKVKTLKIHRIVASAFLENPGNLPQVNHKDEDKKNNRVENLEWCDARYNSNYGTRNERVAKSLSKRVLQFTKEGEFVKEWPSIHEAGRNGFNQGHVWSCCIGKRKSANGYNWRYAE